MLEYILIAGEHYDFGFYLSLVALFVGCPVAVVVSIYLIYRAYKNGRF
jgi:hypothetical protein